MLTFSSLIGLPLYIVDMTMHFSDNIFYLYQCGYKKHARAFRNQIGLNNKFGFRPIWVRKAPTHEKTQINLVETKVLLLR